MNGCQKMAQVFIGNHCISWMPIDLNDFKNKDKQKYSEQYNELSNGWKSLAKQLVMFCLRFENANVQRQWVQAVQAKSIVCDLSQSHGLLLVPYPEVFFLAGPLKGNRWQKAAISKGLIKPPSTEIDMDKNANNKSNNSNSEL